MDTISASFIRFQCILHDQGVLFTESWNLNILKKGDLISGGNPFCRKSELFGPPFCISILKVFQTQILCYSLDINAFCMIRSTFQERWNFYKLKSGDLISGGNQFCRKSYLFRPHFCIWILKNWWTQFLRHSLGFNAFCMIKEHFSQSLESSTY